VLAPARLPVEDESTTVPTNRRSRMTTRLNPYRGFRDDAKQAMEFWASR